MDFVGKRNWFFGLSLAVIVPGILSMAVLGFNLGIDFTGGTLFTLKFNQPVRTTALQAEVNRLNLGGVVQAAGGRTFYIQAKPLQPIQESAAETALAQRFGGVDQKASSISVVGPTIASELIVGAGVAVAAAAVLITAYLALRFRRAPGGGLAFGAAAIAALLHDVFVITGIFSILGRVFNLEIAQINSLFVTAVLTVVGFSVHDTIVIFDRIRENLRTNPRLTFEQAVNLSIIQSAARSIITSFTVILVLLALFLFGGTTIKGFVLALLIGVFSGTYSSIFNASPLLVVWRRWSPALQSSAAKRPAARLARN